MAKITRRKTAGETSPPAPTRAPTACVAIAATVTAQDALTAFLAHLPADTGASFLLTFRQEPELASAQLVEALRAASPIAVEVAGEGVPLEPDRLYVARDQDLVSVEAGRITVRPVPPDDGRVDTLLVSAAEAYEEAGVVVVFLGLGSEGATSVAATKRCGGFAIAEGSDDQLEPEDQAVAAAGIADLRVPAARIGPEVAAYIANLARTCDGDSLAETLREDVGRQIARIAAILRNATGNDFHRYKHATFLRRIQRRMQVVQLDDVDRYIDRLRRDPGEVQRLFQDLLIGVTQFFRDPAEFEVLERDVVPPLFEGKGVDDRIRVWVLGCATGEEAYSLAILLRERMAHMDAPPHVQIFATDIDARALAVARGGRYTESIARHVSPERLARWFVREGGAYCVVEELREMCIFSPHNLINDAPFSRMDLLSCRNLLIYLNSDLQDRVIPIFHSSLKPSGYLFLGPAENVSRHQKLFAPIDRKNRIFRRLETPTRVQPDFPSSPRTDRPEGGGAIAGRPEPPRALTGHIGRRVEQVAERYAPAYLVVGENYDVLHFSGRTGRFLDPASGAASLNVLNLVHRDLRLDLRTALHKAVSQGETTEARNVRLGVDGQARSINIVVEPIPVSEESGALVVLFQDAGPAAEGASPGEGAGVHDQHVARLETELRITRERLQTTIEELESTNEELKSSNEEFQSINEELQSANEELETSNEELQAVNEGLKIVNGELPHRVRNILGVVRSVVARTVRSSTSVDDLAASLDGRLDAFARTQGVFSRAGVAAMDLEDVIRDELVAAAAREEQLEIEGPPLSLRREAAEAFALAMHELTTNAVKYGALSDPAGRLAVRWRVLNIGRGRKLALEWRESGVRALDVAPSRSGFGRDLIERGLPYELGASTSLEFARGGVKATIELPLTDKIADLEAADAETDA